jgi:hypothetical protein
MKIATIINVHDDPKLVLDTLDSVLHYMTDDVLILVDGASTVFDNVDLPVHKMIGFKHGVKKAPYRNVALGLKTIREMYPHHDWYCYLEYDCLVTSIRFKYNLKMADDRGIWMLGSDGRVDDKQIPLVEAMLGKQFNSSYYLLGACQFFSKWYMEKLEQFNFFNRFLSATNDCAAGIMPGYCGYDVSEHLYPSLCREFGGNIGVLSSWDAINEKWHGGYKVFPIRWQPDLNIDTDIYEETSICHPIKDYSHPIRKHQRSLRYVSKIKKYSSTT